jgi:hypothetical protein
MKHLLLILPLLAGCAAPAAAPEACVIQKVIDFPVGEERGLVTVPATLDDQGTTLIFATGAEATMVTPVAMMALQIHGDPRQRTTLTDIGGSFTTQNALLRSMKVGGIEMLDQSVAVGPLPVAPGRDQTILTAPQARAAGLLGADWISDFDVDIDLAHNHIRLYRVHDCEGDYVPWRGPKSTVLAQIYGRGLVLLHVMVDGHPFTAKVDSGSTVSFMGAAAAAGAGLGAGGMAQDPTGRARGTDETVLEAHLHRFDTLQIGDIHYANPHFAITDLHLRQSNMLLGLDWLRHNRVWISYAASRVTIQPESPPAM